MTHSHKCSEITETLKKTVTPAAVQRKSDVFEEITLMIDHILVPL